MEFLRDEGSPEEAFESFSAVGGAVEEVEGGGAFAIVGMAGVGAEVEGGDDVVVGEGLPLGEDVVFVVVFGLDGFAVHEMEGLGEGGDGGAFAEDVAPGEAEGDEELVGAVGLVDVDGAGAFGVPGEGVGDGGDLGEAVEEDFGGELAGLIAGEQEAFEGGWGAGLGRGAGGGRRAGRCGS